MGHILYTCMQLCPNAIIVHTCICMYTCLQHAYRVPLSEETEGYCCSDSIRNLYICHIFLGIQRKSLLLMIGLRRRLVCRCLITWWIPPQLQLACHLSLCHKKTTPNPAHVPWTNGLSPSLWETETIAHRMPRHDRL